jgi:hypothetical protein
MRYVMVHAIDAMFENGKIVGAANEATHSAPTPSRRAALGPVCTKNLIRIDCVTETPNVNGDDRALLALPDPIRLAIQVKEPT